MSGNDSSAGNMSFAMGAVLAGAGLLVGLAGPKLFAKIITKLKPGGKFSKIWDVEMKGTCEKLKLERTGRYGRPVLVKLLVGSSMNKLNRPTAGARSVKELQVGSHPIQLYSLATPNGQKVTIALEEMGLKYDAWLINIMKEDQFTSGFVKVNPNSKIPAMVHRNAPGGERKIFETGSILLYLAELSGKFIPSDPAKRTECFNWLFFSIGEAPYFGQFGHFTRYAPVKIDYAVERYSTEVQRALDVLDKQLEGRSYICGEEYTIADMAWFPWVRALDVFYKASDKLKLGSYKNVVAWRARLEARPATAKGLLINSSAEGGYPEYHS